MYSDLLNSVFKEPDETLYAVVEQHLKKGADVNFASSYGETAIGQSFRRGRMDVVRLLLDHGADILAMRWSPLHQAVVSGTYDDLRRLAQDGAMSDRDANGLTPFLLACAAGEVEKAKALKPLSSDADRQGPKRNTPAILIAAGKNQKQVVEWLLGEGAKVDEADAFGQTALMEAVSWDRAEMVKLLLDAGADSLALYDLGESTKGMAVPVPDLKGMRSRLEEEMRESMPDISDEELDVMLADIQDTMETTANAEELAGRVSLQTVANMATGVEVAKLLISAGVGAEEFDGEIVNQLTGAVDIPVQRITSEIFEAQKHRIFGKKNPDPVGHLFWLEMMRTGDSGYGGNEKYGSGENSIPDSPVWSFRRFGKSTTRLPDGRWVEIAGEHEDHYDPDFCIYNDVFVHSGDGETRIYTYPREVFPPTDFHSASLLGSAIIVIGNLGYQEERRLGYTQVFRLDLEDFSMERIETRGENPGWISEHKAVLDDGKIRVSGGKVQTEAGYEDMSGVFELNIATAVWRRV